jgi:hypothetical protein
VTWSPVPLHARRPLGIVAGAATLFSAVLLWQADAYIGRMWPAQHAGSSWNIEASFRSLFGTIKILRSDADPATGRFARIYFQDGLVQNTVESDGRSLSFYTYALEGPRARLPAAHEIGARAGARRGIVPMRLAGRGVAVEVVEIDPASLAAATRVFGYAPNARPCTWPMRGRSCAAASTRYDVVVVDLFHGDGRPTIWSRAISFAT